MKLLLTPDELLLAINAHLASAGLRGWYEPAEPLAPLVLHQTGKPLAEPLAVVGAPLVFPPGMPPEAS